MGAEIRVDEIVSIRRAALALLVGSGAGAALVLLVGYLPAILFAPNEIAAQWRPSDLYFLLLVLVVAWAVFAVGLVAVAVPFWWLLHRLGWRGWRTAVCLGFLATFIVFFGLNVLPYVLPDLDGSTFSYGDRDGMLVSEDKLTAYGWYNSLESAAIMGLVGAAIGFVIWRIAYRRRSSSPLRASL